MKFIPQEERFVDFTIRQKIGLIIIFGLELIGDIYWKLADFFGLETKSDRVWYFGFITFSLTITFFTVLYCMISASKYIA